jgi:hypothetical protein
MLDVTGDNLQDQYSDNHNCAAEYWSEKWAGSKERQAIRQYLMRLLAVPSRDVAPKQGITNDDEFSASLFQQTLIVSKRILLNQWRDPTYRFNKPLY